LSAIFPLIAAHRNEFGRTSLVGSQPFGLLASRGRNSWLYFIQTHLCLHRLSHLGPPLSCRSGRRLQLGDERQDFRKHLPRHRDLGYLEM
jgi:hypothetical protein